MNSRKQNRGLKADQPTLEITATAVGGINKEEGTLKVVEDSSSKCSFVEGNNGFFPCGSGSEGPLDLEWVSKFLEMDDETCFGFADM